MNEGKTERDLIWVREIFLTEVISKSISWSDKQVVQVKRENAQVFGADDNMWKVLETSKSLSQQ